MGVMEQLDPGGNLPLSVTNRVEDGFAIFDYWGRLCLVRLSAPSRKRTARFNTSKISGAILRVAGVTGYGQRGTRRIDGGLHHGDESHRPIRLVDVSASPKRMLEMTRIDELLPSSSNLKRRSQLRGKARELNTTSNAGNQGCPTPPES